MFIDATKIAMSMICARRNDRLAQLDELLAAGYINKKDYDSCVKSVKIKHSDAVCNILEVSGNAKTN